MAAATRIEFGDSNVIPQYRLRPTEIWLATFVLSAAIAMGLYSVSPFGYGGFASTYLAPLLYPGFFCSVIISGNAHSDSIAPIVVVGSAVFWSTVVVLFVAIVRRVRTWTSRG